MTLSVLLLSGHFVSLKKDIFRRMWQLRNMLFCFMFSSLNVFMNCVSQFGFTYFQEIHLLLLYVCTFVQLCINEYSCWRLSFLLLNVGLYCTASECLLTTAYRAPNLLLTNNNFLCFRWRRRTCYSWRKTGNSRVYRICFKKL